MAPGLRDGVADHRPSEPDRFRIIGRGQQKHLVVLAVFARAGAQVELDGAGDVSVGVRTSPTNSGLLIGVIRGQPDDRCRAACLMERG